MYIRLNTSWCWETTPAVKFSASVRLLCKTTCEHVPTGHMLWTLCCCGEFKGQMWCKHTFVFSHWRSINYLLRLQLIFSLSRREKGLCWRQIATDVTPLPPTVDLWCCFFLIVIIIWTNEPEQPRIMGKAGEMVESQAEQTRLHVLLTALNFSHHPSSIQPVLPLSFLLHPSLYLSLIMSLFTSSVPFVVSVSLHTDQQDRDILSKGQSNITHHSQVFASSLCLPPS